MSFIYLFIYYRENVNCIFIVKCQTSKIMIRLHYCQFEHHFHADADDYHSLNMSLWIYKAYNYIYVVLALLYLSKIIIYLYKKNQKYS